MPYYYSPLRKAYTQDTSKRKPRDSKYPSIFCDPAIIEQQAIRDLNGTIIENEYYRWMINWFPRTEGHTMIVPKRYITRHEDETKEEVWARQEMMIYAMDILKYAFNTDGAEVYNQHGERSFSSIDHLHWHVVPVAKDDPLWENQLHNMEKMGYFYTDNEGEEKIVMFPREIEYAQETLITLLAHTIGEWKR